MLALIVGLGSMGRRRIRNLRSIDSEVQIIGVDSSMSRRAEVSNLHGITVYENLESVMDVGADVSIAFVSTPPSTHGALILNLLDAGIHTFSEINLCDDEYDSISMAAHRHQLQAFLSSTMLYRKEIQYISKKVEAVNKPLQYRYHVGQYLPDWHPWESYKDFFVFNKKTNGCREIAGIELPWIINCFGNVIDYKIISSTISELDLPYSDNHIIVIEHESGSKGVLNIDVASRHAVREFEVYGDSLYIKWGGTPESLKAYDLEKKKFIKIKDKHSYEYDERYSSNIIEDAYVDEVIDFLSTIKSGRRQVDYSYDKDMKIVKLMDAMSL